MLREFRKTSGQELQEVIDGKKPAALGLWDNLPENIKVFELIPVYGRFYDMAVALTEENLVKVVMAYYLPLSIEADIALGKALGYNEEDIIAYTKTQTYPPPLRKLTSEERTIIKIKAEIQKIGIEKVIVQLELYLDGDEDAKHLVEKENLDIKTAIKYLTRRQQC